jgi:hypothetical protein
VAVSNSGAMRSLLADDEADLRSVLAAPALLDAFHDGCAGLGHVTLASFGPGDADALRALAMMRPKARAIRR